MTPPHPKPRILLADDEADLLVLMRETLERQGYDVATAEDGRVALATIRKDPPDIAVLDLNMPLMDGFAVCRELRKDPLFEHLPVIILSASGNRDAKVEGLDLGIDDFITKSVDIQELLARIRMILKRNRKGLDANPLTRLPGNISIESRIEESLEEGKPVAVLYIDLNQFKAYNDSYGYDAGDKVIKATGQLLLKVAREKDGSLDFVGHIGGDDFIVITDPERMEPMAARIIKDFDALVPSFYKEEDRKRGAIVSTDRQGNPREFPLLSLAIGVCHNAVRKLSSYAQVSQYGTELKKQAKTQPGSSYLIDRRRD
ncbi:MAG: response regulator [Elusimicrobiota bacterium]